MVNVGVIGLGMMGLTHLDAYAKRDDVKVVAIADQDQDRLTGKVRAVGNVDGQAQGGFDFNSAKQYTDADELINDPDVQAIDVCLPTHLHLLFADKVFASGKHMLIEKPLARTADDAQTIVDGAANADGISMCAMCMRFWPGWAWAKEAVDQNTYGDVLAATFRRVAAHPGGPFYKDGDKSGGAILDLHIHDTDFVHYLFGMPKAVTSIGYSNETNQPDHVITNYHYDNVPVVSAEGCWGMADKFPFSMHYTINFEKATAVFDMTADNQLMLYQRGGDPAPVALPDAMGYDLEIEYFIKCIEAGKQPQIVTMQDAANTIRIVEAETASIRQGGRVDLA